MDESLTIFCMSQSVVKQLKSAMPPRLYYKMLRVTLLILDSGSQYRTGKRLQLVLVGGGIGMMDNQVWS